MGASLRRPPRGPGSLQRDRGRLARASYSTEAKREKRDIRYPITDARCPIPDIRYPIPDTRCPMSDVRRLRLSVIGYRLSLIAYRVSDIGYRVWGIGYLLAVFKELPSDCPQLRKEPLRHGALKVPRAERSAGPSGVRADDSLY